jgi:hypothetical protein
LQNRCRFHISDEPNLKNLEAYKEAVGFLKGLLDGYPVMDALSNVEFYDQGLVSNPIPATNHIEPFLERKIPNLWTYYCCGQYRDVSNRHFAMPSARNRVLGTQLYKFGITGFLHWGYNFWYSRLSRYPIDPFRVTDSGHAYPSADGFVVYPGEDGPLPSIRLKVFQEGLQDMRAMQLLEQLAGRDAVLGLIEEGMEQPLTFSQYPVSVEWLLNLREKINRRILLNIENKSTV